MRRTISVEPRTAGRSDRIGRLSPSQEPGRSVTVLTTPDGVVERTVLPGGLRVISERFPGVRSASIGVWVGAGSIDERPSQHGCSHFLEHLLFKGTAERSALEISAAFDAVGGEFNAFTAKEYTAYHARVLSEDVPMCVDVLGDMLTSSRLTSADVEAERGIILDEIAMHDDDPDDLVHNQLAEQAWPGSPPGRSIAGTEESIAALSREQIVRYLRRHYRPGDMVVAAAGDIDHTALVDLVARAFARADFLAGDDTPRLLPTRSEARPVTPGTQVVRRPFEQVSLALAMNGVTRTDDRRYALSVLTAVLGGGPSSRLFQQVRERLGLAYSIYSFATHHTDAGLVGVSAGCLPGRVEAVLESVRAELAALARDGVDDEELTLARGMLRGSLVLGLEDGGARMSRLAKAELIHGEVLSVDESIDRLLAVGTDDLHALADEVFTQPEVLALVGPL